MILICSIGLSLLVGLLTGGRLRRLANARFQLGELVFLALALQVASVYASSPRWLPVALLLASYVLLLVVIVLNLRMPGLALIGLGLIANTLVIAANGGYMPVTADTVSQAGLEHLVTTTDAGNRILGSKDVVLPWSETRLWPLSDIMVIREPLPTIFSLGDVLLAVGAFWFIQGALRPPREDPLANGQQSKRSGEFSDQDGQVESQ